MSITTSTIIEDLAQVDGRRHVRERHVDHLGGQHFVSYIADSGDNATTAMNTRVSNIEAELKQSEINANLAKALNGETDTFIFQHSTANENLAALRELFKASTKWELITLAHVLHHQNLSNAQIRGLFGVSAGQEQTVKNKLAANDTRYHDILAEEGI